MVFSFVFTDSFECSLYVNMISILHYFLIGPYFIDKSFIIKSYEIKSQKLYFILPAKVLSLFLHILPGARAALGERIVFIADGL